MGKIVIAIYILELQYAGLTWGMRLELCLCWYIEKKETVSESALVQEQGTRETLLYTRSKHHDIVGSYYTQGQCNKMLGVPTIQEIRET